MMPAGQEPLRGFTVGRGDKQFVCPEILVGSATDWNIQALKDGRVKPPRGSKVSYYQLNVIDQSTPVQCLRFHSVLLSAGLCLLGLTFTPIGAHRGRFVLARCSARARMR